MALFKANITNNLTEDELIEQLYIFLNEYVPTRLVYENMQEREDCIQDTIMYLLKRYKLLSPKEKNEENLEKFFYNRARSYISLYIKKLQTSRKNKREYVNMCQYLQEGMYVVNRKYINHVVLNKVLNAYKLSEDNLEKLKNIVIFRLVKDFNFDDNLLEVEFNRDESLYKLATSVIDEYVLESAINEELGEWYIETYWHKKIFFFLYIK